MTWFWMGSLHKNIQLMLRFLKGPFLVLHFSYQTLMSFLMLSVILLSILMMLLSTLNVIRHLICSNNQDWLLNLNLIYKTLWTGAGSELLISMLEKLYLFCLTSLKTLVLLWMDGPIIIINGPVFEEKSSFEILGLFSLPNYQSFCAITSMLSNGH